MPEATQKTSAPRRGATRANRPVAAKPAVKKAAPATDAESAETVQVGPLVLEPHEGGDTKQYSRWVPPAGSGCVGTFYAPLGATGVEVTISGPAA